MLIEFDPNVISYREILLHFFEMHGYGYARPGSQYRSAIFVYSDEQRQVAEEVKAALVEAGERVATEITPAGRFWFAEDYHQQYAEKRGLGTSVCGILTGTAE